MPYSYQMTSRVLCNAQYHKQHYTLHAFEQFGALHINNIDNKHPIWSGFESSTSAFRATAVPNESSEPATNIIVEMRKSCYRVLKYVMSSKAAVCKICCGVKKRSCPINPFSMGTDFRQHNLILI